jgi:hypothetical protein
VQVPPIDCPVEALPETVKLVEAGGPQPTEVRLHDAGTTNRAHDVELLVDARAARAHMVVAENGAARGEQQMCASGRGLMARPRLLMIDRLSLGLAPVAVDMLVDALHARWKAL